MVAILGRPSAGKSTLINALCGGKVSIVSPVPQTTRNQVRGILNASEGQLLLIDTPGYQLSEKKLNTLLRRTARTSLQGVDVALGIVDGSRPQGEEEQEVLRLVTKVSPHLLAVNKIDLPAAARRVAEIADRSGEEVIGVSALTGEGLPVLQDRLFALSPPGPRLYPDDHYTDQPPQFRIAEIIREQAILRTHDELPHALYVEIADLETRPGELLWVRAFINVERDSQRGIVVGRAGEKIRAIRLEAQAQLNKVFSQEVHLDLRVKVHKKWRSDDDLLRGLAER